MCALAHYHYKGFGLGKMKYGKHIEESFKKAENNESKLPIEILRLRGHSGVKTRHLYNNLCGIDGINYLELGLFTGSTFVSSLFQNNISATGVDLEIKKEFRENVDNHKGWDNVNLIEGDAFELDVSTLGKFDIYLYDGNHSKESHEKSLTYFIDCLNDSFIFIVDDWNWLGVREGTEDAINKLGLVINYEKEIRTTSDDTHPKIKCQNSDWHNGICVYELTK